MKVWTNKDLYDLASEKIERALDEYDHDDIEMGDIPTRIHDMMNLAISNANYHLFTQCFWLDDNDSDLDTALDSMIGYVINKKVMAYAVNLDTFDDGFVFVSILEDKRK